MYNYNSEDLFNAVKARQEADYDLELLQQTHLDLADKVTIEDILGRQFGKVSKASAEVRALKVKAKKLAKAEKQVAKQTAEAERRYERKLKDAYRWSSLD